jgi:hypothetical protein
MGLMKRAVSVVVCVIAVGWPAAAVADSCANVSRAAPHDPTTVSKGNWVWLPSIDPSLPPVWGFAPPGSPDSTAFGLPGANGNYTNGQTSSLLGMSNNCPPGNNSARQTSHGIQSGCV